MNKIFKYIENLWIGMDGRPSLKSILAIAFSINFIHSISTAVRRWDAGKSLSDLALVLAVEAGLITALLGLKVYANVQQSALDAKNPDKPDKQGPME